MLLRHNIMIWEYLEIMGANQKMMVWTRKNRGGNFWFSFITGIICRFGGQPRVVSDTPGYGAAVSGIGGAKISRLEVKKLIFRTRRPPPRALFLGAPGLFNRVRRLLVPTPESWIEENVRPGWFITL